MDNNLQLCRTCLTHTGEFQSIFVSDDSIDTKIHLSEMITSFTKIQITLGDGLPELICSSCAENTLNFYKFKIKCEQSNDILRQKYLDESQNIIIEKCDIDENIEIIIKPEIDDLSENFINIVNNKNEQNIDNNKCVRKKDYELNYTSSSQESEKDDLFKAEEYKCDYCPKICENYIVLNRHVKTHTQIKPFECETCNKRFTRNDLLLRHKIAHAIKMNETNDHQNGSNDINEDNVMIDDMIIIKTDPDIFYCNICSIYFFQKKKLNEHMKTHLNCSYCSKKFNKLSLLNRHLRTHQSKPYSCKICNKKFYRSEQLTNHMNIHSGIKPHICEICLKGFNQISNLKDHMRTHNGEKPFLCSTCGRGFNQLGNLRQHTIRHSGIKAHLCSICGNGFASKGELSAHLRKHTGARPFVCNICNHGFTTSSSLTKHKRIHSGEKPYECDVCFMKFSRSGILARHKRTHTGEKPYVCKFCSKAFSQSNDLTSHLRIHTGEKPYICDACGQAFRQSSALKSHKKTHDEKKISDKKTFIEIIRTNSPKLIENKNIQQQTLLNVLHLPLNKL